MNYTARLLEIKDESDSEVARLIAEAALESDKQPYCFSINHNVGAPDFKGCPLVYDFRWGKTVGINTMDRKRAYLWIVSALNRGYTVTRAGHKTQGIKDREPYGFAYDISHVRLRAFYHQQPKPENDDDIPF